MTRTNSFGIPVALVLSASISALPGCGDDHEHEHGEESIEEEACEHLSEGPSQAVTAAADQSGGLEAISIEHTRVDVALTAVEGGNGGWVSFVADEDGDFTFFLNAEVDLAVFDAAGTEVEIEESVIGSDACDDIAVAHTVELEVGTYALNLGPTSASSVGIVTEHLGGEHEHEHE